ncbi:zinc-binding protein A33 [Pleurodeles waltl]|uniref:zinc-binding protein A33 n=1 Tax=Pleurodeles waltl TaxID=8319 RepID=UPI0037095C41
MANSTVAEPEKMEQSGTCEEDEEEENMEGDEDECDDDEEENMEPAETVTIGSTYKCRRSDNTLHAAEIIKTRKTKENAEEFYVHYVGLNRRQNEWVDKSRVLQAKQIKTEELNNTEDETNGVSDQSEGKTARSNKRKIEDGDGDQKKRKVDDEEDDFTEDLTCPLCRSLFKEPVILECGHNFCKHCIDKSWESASAFSCPECKEVLTERKYTTNRVLANLVKKAAVGVKDKDVKPKEKCDEHDERLKLFCKDDGTLACVICRDSLKHSNHNFLPIQDAVGVYRDQLIALVSPLETTMKENQKLKCDQSQKISLHRENIVDYKKHIECEFEKLHQFLREKEAKMVEDLNAEAEGLLKDMEANLVKMTDNCEFIEEAISTTQSRLNESDPIAFLTDIKSFIEKCCEEHRKGVPAESVLVNKELSQGRFKGPLQYIIWKELKSVVQPGLAPLTLDPNTAHPNLVLSEGLTSVKYTDTKQQLPDNPKRFSQCILVLGAEGFDSGKHYWEVEVGNKTAWDVGMASESSNRKGKIKLNPKNGYWAIWLRNGNAFKALESPSKTLNLTSKPSKIGVYLDYEGGQVSFYNADDMSPIYTFNGSFTEKLYPYLSPFLQDSGKNAEPLKLVHTKL